MVLVEVFLELIVSIDIKGETFGECGRVSFESYHHTPLMVVCIGHILHSLHWQKHSLLYFSGRKYWCYRYYFQFLKSIQSWTTGYWLYCNVAYHIKREPILHLTGRTGNIRQCYFTSIDRLYESNKKQPMITANNRPIINTDTIGIWCSSPTAIIKSPKSNAINSSISNWKTFFRDNNRQHTPQNDNKWRKQSYQIDIVLWFTAPYYYCYLQLSSL